MVLLYQVPSYVGIFPRSRSYVPGRVELCLRNLWESRWRNPVSRVGGNMGLGGIGFMCSSDLGCEGKTFM